MLLPPRAATIRHQRCCHKHCALQVLTESTTRLFVCYPFFAAIYNGINMQLLPPYLVVYGSSLQYAGFALSCGKAGSVVAMLCLPYCMAILGMLRSYYFFFCFSIFGSACIMWTVLMDRPSSSYFVDVFLIGIFFTGANHGIFTLIQSYIHSSTPRSKQAARFAYLSVFAAVGSFMAPLLVQLYPHIIIGHFFLTAASVMYLTMLIFRYGLSSKEIFSRQTTTQKNNAVRCISFTTQEKIVILASVVPYVYTAVWSNLFTLVCTQSFGWEPSGTSLLILPIYVFQTVAVICVPLLMNRVSLRFLMQVSCCVTVTLLVTGEILTRVLNITLSPLGLGIIIIGGVGTEVCLTIYPTLLLSVNTTQANFAFVVTAITLFDSIINVFNPFLILRLYEVSIATARDPALQFVFTYEVIVSASALMYLNLPKVSAV